MTRRLLVPRPASTVEARTLCATIRTAALPARQLLAALDQQRLPTAREILANVDQHRRRGVPAPSLTPRKDRP